MTISVQSDVVFGCSVDELLSLDWNNINSQIEPSSGQMNCLENPNLSVNTSQSNPRYKNSSLPLRQACHSGLAQNQYEWQVCYNARQNKQADQ